MSEEINERFKDQICNMHHECHVEMWKNMFKTTLMELEESCLNNDRLLKEMEKLYTLKKYNELLNKIILKNMLKNETCSICQEPFEDDFITTECEHYFHKKCLNKVVKTSNSCPLCRKQLQIESSLLT